MSAVTVQEIVEALRGPIGAAGNAKRKELADRIEQHGIAPSAVYRALLAAAPDLLEALEYLMDEVTDIRGIDVEEYKPRAFDLARAAIAKARGNGGEK